MVDESEIEETQITGKRQSDEEVLAALVERLRGLEPPPRGRLEWRDKVEYLKLQCEACRFNLEIRAARRAVCATVAMAVFAGVVLAVGLSDLLWRMARHYGWGCF